MAKVRVEINHDGAREILRSEAVRRELLRRAERIAAAAGPGHEAHAEIGPNRADAEAVAVSFAARASEAKNHTLTRAIDAGRG